MIKGILVPLISTFLMALVLNGVCEQVASASAPSLSFVPPTPADGTITTDTTHQIKVSITEQDLAEFNFNWNGANYLIYDDSLKLMMNFDNVGAIGETGTRVVDISRYNNDGTCNWMGASGTYTAGKYGQALSFEASLYPSYSGYTL